MKYLIFVLLVFSSCNTQNGKIEKQRKDFSKEEQSVIRIARDIIKQCYYGTLITIDENGQPRARIMEPFAPDENFVIWLATNPRSRKVKQLEKNSKATMHYFDKSTMGYVSLMGNAFLENDKEVKKEKWKDGWERFYKNQEDDYMLIRFVPEYLEIISIPNGFTGDSLDWKPHRVDLWGE